MKIKMFSFLIIVMAFSSCIKKSVEGVVLSDATTFEKKMSAPNVQLIDVRTPEEFAEGHLPKAVNIDVNSDDFETKVTSLDKEQPVMVYCKMGGRSAKAAEKLKELGFKNITDLDGGFSNWSNENKPIEK